MKIHHTLSEPHVSIEHDKDLTLHYLNFVFKEKQVMRGAVVVKKDKFSEFDF